MLSPCLGQILIFQRYGFHSKILENFHAFQGENFDCNLNQKRERNRRSYKEKLVVIFFSFSGFAFLFLTYTNVFLRDTENICPRPPKNQLERTATSSTITCHKSNPSNHGPQQIIFSLICPNI